MQEVFEKIDAIFKKYRKKWLEQPNTEPCKGLECIANDCVDCMLTHLENDINQVAEEYNQSLTEINQSLTNADKIRSMTDEELAEFLFKYSNCECCCISKKCTKIAENSCIDTFLAWLQSEVEE